MVYNLLSRSAQFLQFALTSIEIWPYMSLVKMLKSEAASVKLYRKFYTCLWQPVTVPSMPRSHTAILGLLDQVHLNQMYTRRDVGTMNGRRICLLHFLIACPAATALKTDRPGGECVFVEKMEILKNSVVFLLDHQWLPYSWKLICSYNSRDELRGQLVMKYASFQREKKILTKALTLTKNTW